MSSRSSKRHHKQRGFTLIEVLISIVLLAFISIAIYQATTETYRLRDVLSQEGEFYNSIRLSMGILQRDVQALYTPTVLLQQEKGKLPPPADARDLEAIISSDQGRTAKYWSAAVDKTGLRPMRFVGSENKLAFVTTSHIRVYKEAPESEFAKVSYELREDTAEGAIEGTRVLVRVESPNAFDDEDDRDKFKRTYPLLRGVKKLRYRFYFKEKDTFASTWDSDTSDQKNLFPDYVELTIEVQGPVRLQFEGLYKFRPELPLNALPPTT